MRATFADRVYEVVADLAPGELVSYGDVAAAAGRPGAARAVGNLMAGSDGLPWWRIVTATGRLVPGLEKEHARRLEAEGFTIEANHVASDTFLTECLTDPPDAGADQH